MFNFVNFVASLSIVGLSNSNGSTEEGFVVATVLLQGQEYTYALPVTMTGESTQNLIIIFPKAITPIVVYPCSTKPGGINEGPDVVGLNSDEQPE